jgi:2,5-diketo-D-gluconate reductase B
VAVPPLGLGTWSVDGETCAEAVERALDVGYRHVDTAQLYGNEQAVGEALARSSVPRDAVWIATKVDPERLAPDDLVESVHESRERLGIDVIDCVYVHWPRAAYDAETTLPALASLVDDGVVRGVGVSNFTPRLLTEARSYVSPVAHQLELHPLCPQTELLAEASEHGTALVAYSPLARGEALGLAPVEAVAEQHGATPAQVVLAWIRAKGAIPIPKATGDHIAENYRSLDLDLSAEDVARIDAVEREKRVVDPPSAPWNPADGS